MGDLEARLDEISDKRWAEIKSANQMAYDDVMAPEKVAAYLIDTALGGSAMRQAVD